MPASDRWWARPQLWIEVFVIANFGFLVLDIYLAHSENQFRNHAEYIPLAFSAVAPIVLVLGLVVRAHHPAVWKALGHLVGWLAIVVGITGLVLHLQSHFFVERTLRSLTYSAPFAAPLAYAGLGFLLVMNRMVDPDSPEWAQWIILLALGGFVGNFVFSLADHAENGFFEVLEWVPVFVAALAVGFLTVPLVMRVSRAYIHVAFAILVLEAAVGVWGFVLHTAGNLRGPSPSMFQNFIYGAPAMAPLLFPNLALLAAIGLVQLRHHTNGTSARRSDG